MASIVVTTALDVVNAGDGLTSLREAVTAANDNADADSIAFAVALSGQTLILTQANSLSPTISPSTAT